MTGDGTDKKTGGGPGGDGAGDVEISLIGSDQDGQDHE